jgi:hypothetical protein
MVTPNITPLCVSLKQVQSFGAADTEADGGNAQTQ